MLQVDYFLCHEISSLFLVIGLLAWGKVIDNIISLHPLILVYLEVRWPILLSFQTEVLFKHERELLHLQLLYLHQDDKRKSEIYNVLDKIPGP